MFSRQAYGEIPALNALEYYRRLYEADVPGRLLDFIGDRYHFEPFIFVRGLHEGHPIASLLRADGYGEPEPNDGEREIGDSFLLVFAAVALQRYEELGRDEWTENFQGFYTDAVRDLVDALSQDGYRYRNGRIFMADGTPVTPTLEPVPPVHKQKATKPPLERKNETPHVVGENEKSEPALLGQGWSAEAKIGFWSLVAVVVLGIVTVIATVASPEVRAWLRLDKPTSTQQDSGQHGGKK